MAPAGDLVPVTHRVDGDTVTTPQGKVRIIGIDTPEQGDCGFAAANARADELLAASGWQVTMIRPAGEPNTDKYDRLLRSLTLADGSDFGLAMIQSGVARARYDSLDGYAAHPQQTAYRSAQAAAAPDPNLWATC